MSKKPILQILALVLVLSMILSTAAFAMPPGQAKKIQNNEDKYYKAFKHMKEKGIMYGYGDDSYGLEDYVKRGDITVMIVRAFKLSMMGIDMEEIQEDFLDLIDKNSYYYDSVKTAKRLGIAKGDGKNFHPNKYVTYDEAILLIERAVKVANSNVTIINDDGDEVKLRDWYGKLVKNDKDAFKDLLYKLLKDEDIKDYTKAAKREDIALMLYYVMTGEDYDKPDKDEIKDIKLYLEDFKGSFSNVKTSVFRKAFEDIEDNKYNNLVEYLVFGDIINGELHYKYNAKRPSSSEVDDEKYYFDDKDEREIKDLTFLMGKDTSSYIKYKAYIKENGKYIAYPGRIIIEDTKESLVIKSIEIDDYEGEVIDFAGELKKLDKEIFTRLDYVRFQLPKEGDLLIRYDNSKKYLSVDKDKDYDLEDIIGIKYIAADDADDDYVSISYRAYDKYNNTYKRYQGKIEIELD